MQSDRREVKQNLLFGHHTIFVLKRNTVFNFKVVINMSGGKLKLQLIDKIADSYHADTGCQLNHFKIGRSVSAGLSCNKEIDAIDLLAVCLFFLKKIELGSISKTGQ